MRQREPLYIHVMQNLKERIINGIYEIGSLIPTETELEKEFNVSKITIRKAIELLEYEGYVKKQSGKGTTVLSNDIYNILTKKITFAQILQSEGMSMRKEKTSIKTITLTPNDELYIYFKDQCTKITRMYYLDGHPYIYYTHYLPGDLDIPQFEDDNQFSVYTTLFKNHYTIESFRDEFYVDYPSLQILSELQIKNGPVLGRKRITYGPQEKVIEISYSQYNTKMAHFISEYNI